MESCKDSVLRNIERELLTYFDVSDVPQIMNVIIKNMVDYDVFKSCTDVIIKSDINQKIVKQYMGCLYVDGKSEKTIYQYYRSATLLSDTLNKPFTEMGVYDIRFYLALRKRQGISNRSLENTRANLSAFFQWMMREKLIISNPCLNIKPIKYKQEIRMPFSDVEIDALRSACKTLKERAIIELLLSSGIRVSELVMLNVDDIDKQALSVHIKYGKGNKERTTYITKVAMKHIENYLNNRNEQHSALFCNYQHQRMHDNGVRYLLNTLAKRADVTNVHPHRFRRTFACCLSARGMNIQDIQKLLGHTNINTTMEYVTIDDGRLQSSYQYYIV